MSTPFFEQTFGRLLTSAFTEEQARLLIAMFEAGFDMLAKTSDLSELKQLVRELAESQRETDERLKALAESQRESDLRFKEALAESRRETDRLLKELAESRRETDERLKALAESQRESDLRFKEALAESRRETDRLLKELAESRRETDERLKALAESQRESDLRFKEALAESRRETDRLLKELAESRRETDQRFKALTEAQRRADERIDRLTERVEALTEAQRQTDERLARLTERVEALTEAQQRTEQSLRELIEIQKQMLVDMQNMRFELGGLSRAASYALENEAYRNLPPLLERALGIKLDSRMIRTEIDDEEINVLAFGKRLEDGRAVAVVGEAKLQLDKRTAADKEFERTLQQIKRKVEVIQNKHPDKAVIPVLVTHFARPSYVQRAQEQGITVIQSFEW